jgi:hypothetical protein
VSARSDRTPIVGFVCEGSTDVVILRRVVETVLGAVDVRVLQPQTDELDRVLPGARVGWSEVKAWCERITSFDEIFEPLIGEPIDLLIVCIDLDIAVKAGVDKGGKLKAYDAKELCKVVKSWLPARLPSSGRLVIAIPVHSIESWILAAIFPKRRGAPEQEREPASVLVSKNKIEMGRNGPWKRAVQYRVFADAIGKRLEQVRKACTEADRFVRKLELAKSHLAGD